MVPTYPAPSALVRSTLNPVSVWLATTPLSISSLALAYLSFSSYDNSAYLISFNFF
jgi:hypothetical protein